MRMIILGLLMACAGEARTPEEVCAALQEEANGICAARGGECVVVICGSQCGTLLPDTEPLCENFSDLPSALTTRDALFEGETDCLADCENQWGSIHSCRSAQEEDGQKYDYLLAIH